ncbi:MAG: DUF4446 family protein [bacterium]|nr:DUF4446 family protein [bacterium]
MQVELILSGVGTALAIGVGVWVFFLDKKFRNLFLGKKEKTVESLVYNHEERVRSLEGRVKDLETALTTLNSNFLKAVQKVGIIRFNPFQDTGGDQSFAIALLDGVDTGFVISSIFAQGRPMVYAKPIVRGQSKYTLSAEEEEAIQRATEGRSNEK